MDGSLRRRPCLNFQMKRCLAPCAGEVSQDDYLKVVEDVTLFLKGKNSDLMDKLKASMKDASEAMRYEEAAIFRDKINLFWPQLRTRTRSTFLFSQSGSRECFFVVSLRKTYKNKPNK